MKMSKYERLETKDEGGAPSVSETKKAIAEVMTAFEEFKKTNDASLAEIKAKGASDPVLEEKLVKIEKTLIAHEAANQKLTLVEQQKKAVDDLGERFDAIETAMKRKSTGDVAADTEHKNRVETWARSVIDASTKGVLNLDAEQQKLLQDVRNEYKALSVTPDTAGGYLAPVEYVREIIKSVTEISPVRSLARVRQTANKSVQIPKRTGQFAAVWVAEQGTRSETTGLTYGLEEIHTHEVYALVDISNQMLEDSAFNMQSEISEESSEQFALAEGTAFVSGNGVGKPEGFLSHSGLLTTNSGTAANIADADGQANGLLSLKYAIKSAYHANSTWVMNRTTIGAARRLKDAEKNYIWQSGIALGRPNTIDGDPYVEMTDMPSEGAGLKPIVYGDFRRAYTWVDRIAMEMLRDPYTQATSGNVRFIMRKRVGGQVVLVEAIRALVCST
jgi:HK97 family phage major capsid protein